MAQAGYKFESKFRYPLTQGVAAQGEQQKEEDDDDKVPPLRQSTAT